MNVKRIRNKPDRDETVLRMFELDKRFKDYTIDVYNHYSYKVTLPWVCEPFMLYTTGLKVVTNDGKPTFNFTTLEELAEYLLSLT